MFKKATYHQAITKKGLFALSLVFSLFAFPGYVNTAEACRLLPQHIEVIAIGQEVAESAAFTYQITNSDFSANTLNTSRDYEINVQLVYQRQIKEALDAILIQSYTYSPPTFFRIVKTVPSHRDDSPLLTLG